MCSPLFCRLRHPCFRSTSPKSHHTVVVPLSGPKLCNARYLWFWSNSSRYPADGAPVLRFCENLLNYRPYGRRVFRVRSGQLAKSQPKFGGPKKTFGVYNIIRAKRQRRSTRDHACSVGHVEYYTSAIFPSSLRRASGRSPDTRLSHSVNSSGTLR